MQGHNDEESCGLQITEISGCNAEYLNQSAQANLFSYNIIVLYGYFKT